jgi:hypothetical protein
LKELVAGSLGKNSGSAETASIVAVQIATLEALAVVLGKGGSKAKLPISIPSTLDASKELLGHADESVRESAAKVMGAACDLLGSDATEDVIRKEILPGNDESGTLRHGKACAIRHIFSASTARELNESLSSDLLGLAIVYMKDDKGAVKEAGCAAVGAAVGRSKDPKASLRKVRPELLAIMGNTKEAAEVLQAVAKGLFLSLQLSEGVVIDRVSFFGIPLLNACLQLALSASQRVQFAYNDVLYMALDVANGQKGLDKYTAEAMFENSKQMKSLYTTILSKIKATTILTILPVLLTLPFEIRIATLNFLTPYSMQNLEKKRAWEEGRDIVYLYLGTYSLEASK